MAAKDYKIFDGTNWVSPCDQEIRILKPDGVTWQLLDPNNEDVKYFDGSTWKPMLCVDPVPPAPPIRCTQGSLSGSGGSGIYYIPMLLEANVCDVTITLSVVSVPDSLAILSADKSTVLMQTGFFGSDVNPTPGPYNFGLFKPRKIYTYNPSTPSNFSLDPFAPNETLTVLPNQFPITDTNPLNVPNSKDPANPTQTVRTITWTKGVTPTDVNVLIRVVGHPDSGTAWTISAIGCANCPPPTPPPALSVPCPNCVPGLVTIGSQTWTKCNATVTKYRNGNLIPQVSDPTAWAALTTGAWCWYNNDPANEAIYGKLYNWYAVNDPRGFAPVGYHVPTDAEWTTLTDSLGGASVSGNKMREVGVCHWSPPNADATDTSNFTGLPGGNRGFSGIWANFGGAGHWWSTTPLVATSIYARFLIGNNPATGRGSFGREVGLSVRFIKD